MNEFIINKNMINNYLFICQRASGTKSVCNKGTTFCKSPEALSRANIPWSSMKATPSAASGDHRVHRPVHHSTASSGSSLGGGRRWVTDACISQGLECSPGRAPPPASCGGTTSPRRLSEPATSPPEGAWRAKGIVGKRLLPFRLVAAIR